MALKTDVKKTKQAKQRERYIIFNKDCNLNRIYL